MTVQIKLKSINDLPDEIICIIMCHVSSMRDKLRFGATSDRFSRCLDEHLASCQWPLRLHFTEAMHKSWSSLGIDLNSFIGGILNDMGKRTNFQVISFEFDHVKLLESIGQVSQYFCQRPKALARTKQLTIRYAQIKLLSQLCAENERELVTAQDVHNGKPGLPQGVYQLLDKCKHLQVLHLSHVLPDFPSINASLNGRGLTEISLHACSLDQEPLIKMFQSLKPNTLKSVKLDVTLRSLNAGGINIASFLQQMREGPWTAVETLHYNFTIPINIRDFGVMAELPRLFPKLRHCLPHCSLSFQPTPQHFIACVKGFLEEAKRLSNPSQCSLVFGHSCQWQRWTACRLKTLLESVMDRSVVRFCSMIKDQKEGGGSTTYAITFGSRNHPCVFKLFNVSEICCGSVFGDELCIRCPYDHFEMPDDDNEHVPCDVCRTIYPDLLSKLKRMVDERQGGHVEDYFLTPCKAHLVAEDLVFPDWKSQVAVTRDQLSGTYTISVEDFHITVESRPCIVPGCVECWRT